MKAAETRGIGLSSPYVDEREEELVAEVLRSGRLSLGPCNRAPTLDAGRIPFPGLFPDTRSSCDPSSKSLAMDRIATCATCMPKSLTDSNSQMRIARSLIPSGTQRLLDNRAGWAKTYLLKAGLLESPRRAFIRITERGRQALGFLISPCRPRTPEHKGKVEHGGVHYVKRNFLAGRAFRDVHEANERVLVWCLETAGRRIHGTTKEQPLARIDTVEREALLPLPAVPYALATWKQAKHHPDCHVVFDHAFYSAPHRLIGQKLWVRGADTSVRIFYQHELVATHPRASRRGQRLTHPDHLPPAKVAGLMATPAGCLRRADEIGPATSEVIGRLLGERPLDRSRTALGILKLAHKFSPRRLEAACVRAVHFDDLTYGTVKRILDRGLDQAAPPPVPRVATPTALPLFARPVTDFFPPTGGGSCNRIISLYRT